MTWFSKPTDASASNAHEATATCTTAFAVHRVDRMLRHRWTFAVALGCTMLSIGPGWTGTSSAGFPEMVERVGRFCGCSWGDGYHTCHSSGMRPMANLPPRSYPARTGNLGDKVMGCRTCQSSTCQGTCQSNSSLASVHRDGFSRLRPTLLPATSRPTFYDRFDEYAREVSFQAAAAEVGAHPVDAILDHESIEGHYPQTKSPRFELHSNHIDDFTHHGFSVLAGEDPLASSQLDPTSEDAEATSDASAESDLLPKHQLTEEEIQRFRDYQEHQRLEKKYQKYLIDPEEIEPRQTFGGPPVGSEQRRLLDEHKVNELLKQKTQQLLPPANPKNGSPEDLLPSPSDLLDSSLEVTEPDDALPLEELLPPYPDDQSDSSIDSAGPLLRPTPLATDSLTHSTRSFIRQPSDETNVPHSTESSPAERVAEVPVRHFIRQPR
ncbi:hypothetical protein [Rhodopirellula bahusiensis]|uniref:Uncharacterized protein n=1 Tax=Rhodopirellula bahusiensis TaxID=2014065 RepID=A0A2G1W5E4_9BACT|nr:hypothetical protein [Rhodopirellula bahusiensis]PHQ34221.1 hypothetical protein CEE69_16400 [Rhodopirellula bahusiensis]